MVLQSFVVAQTAAFYVANGAEYENFWHIYLQYETAQRYYGHADGFDTLSNCDTVV